MKLKDFSKHRKFYEQIEDKGFTERLTVEEEMKGKFYTTGAFLRMGMLRDSGDYKISVGGTRGNAIYKLSVTIK